ncbi:Hypothetical protein R9X50_00711900 [Acrodontium crateriforme]|uniref:Alpha/beta hydrolase fold-3 domain-containing protein n=1 Tax=Acrodontium crateriforme TaxID=150365 RepID=A0AAQ3RCK3_9PEZI|nr:Hypothetical protein R9X50_00711900 [Acrodontium crateriforme]
MIDHVAGRPSPRFRKYQVFTVVLLWTIYLSTTDRHGPKPIRSLSRYLSRKFTAWRGLVTFCLTLYVSRNFARVVGLHSPEPLANLYTRSYFRATWVTTALDAGFWTAMNIRPVFLRDLASIIFTLYYLVCAEQADEMVRRVRGQLTLQHLRVSWDKPNTPYIRAFTNLFRGKLMSRKPERLRIARPKVSDYTEPIEAWLYFDGPRDELKYHDKIILDIPGGGFVAMDPRCHDDKLMAWAGRTGLPVLALNYKKAPEYPYPYALHECYDVYHSIISSRGRCVGLAGTHMPKIVLSGDSAGGNLAVGLTLMLLQDSPHASYYAGDRAKSQLPLPESLVLIYPALDVNINNWITDEQMSLIRAPEKRKINQGILERKRTDYTNLTPNTPHGSDEGLDMKSLPRIRSKPAQWLSEDGDVIESPAAIKPTQPRTEVTTTTSDKEPAALRTRLAMSSMISYFNDRILSPEMLRSMIILYIGPHQRPDFATDYLLSPLLAPEQLLVRFPKTYMLCGERDPLVDNTVIFAGRIREARKHQLQERKELGLVPADTEFDDTKHVEVMLVPGISHGFLQFVSVYPEGWKYIFQCSRWMKEVFQASVARDLGSRGSSSVPSPTLERSHPVSVGVGNAPPSADYFSHNPNSHRRQKSSASCDANSDTEDRPLEMSRLRMTSSISSKQHAAGLSALNATPTSHVTTHHHNRTGTTSSSPSSTRKSLRAAPFSGRRSPLATRKSLVRLSSQEDLMKRRMQGLTMGLVNGDEDGVPGTP